MNAPFTLNPAEIADCDRFAAEQAWIKCAGPAAARLWHAKEGFVRAHIACAKAFRANAPANYRNS